MRKLNIEELEMVAGGAVYYDSADWNSDCGYVDYDHGDVVAFNAAYNFALFQYSNYLNSVWTSIRSNSGNDAQAMSSFQSFINGGGGMSSGSSFVDSTGAINVIAGYSGGQEMASLYGTSPFAAVGQAGLAMAGAQAGGGSADEVDTDGDGVPDVNDEDPNDPAIGPIIVLGLTPEQQADFDWRVTQKELMLKGLIVVATGGFGVDALIANRILGGLAGVAVSQVTDGMIHDRAVELVTREFAFPDGRHTSDGYYVRDGLLPVPINPENIQ